MQNRMLLAFLGAAFACLFTTGAVADDEPIGGWAWGIYGGAAIPDPNELDTGPTGGMRIGYRTSEHSAISGSLGYATVEGETGSGITKIKGDVDSWLLDFDAWYIFRPQSRLSFTIGAGPGWAWNDG